MAKSDAQARIRSQHSVPCPIDLISALVVPAWVKENRRPGVTYVRPRNAGRQL